jgi:hypothetical protein
MAAMLQVAVTDMRFTHTSVLDSNTNMKGSHRVKGVSPTREQLNIGAMTGTVVSIPFRLGWRETAKKAHSSPDEDTGREGACLRSRTSA